MRRLVSLVLLVLIAAAMGGFAVANRAVVIVSLPWSDWEIGLPLFLVLFIGILIGVLLTLPAVFWATVRRAVAVRRERRRAEEAERRLAALEGEHGGAQAAAALAHIDKAQSRGAS